MQQAQSPAKLENIKSIRDILPGIADLHSQCVATRDTMDGIFTNLRGIMREQMAKVEDAARREQKEQEYADLKKQREQERIDAERKVDEKAEQHKKAVAEKAKAVEEARAERVFQPTQQPERTERPPFQPREQRPDRPPFQRSGEQRPPYQQHGQRPPFQPGQQRPPYQQHGQRPPFQPGQRPPFQQRPGQPGQPSRTWTPNQSSGYGQRQGGYTGYSRPGGDRPAFGQQRPWTPRPPGAGPRPGGAGAATALPKFPQKANTHDPKRKDRGFSGERSQGGYDRRQLLRRGIIEEQDIEERMLTRMFRTKKAKENAERAVPKEQSNIIKVTTHRLTVKELSEKAGIGANQLIKQLIVLGEMATVNSTIDFDLAALVAGEFGLELQLHADKSFEEQMSDIHNIAEDEADMSPRPPVVTVMGHVDHGKTTLLDVLRQTKVTAGEAGGITQHIGAYQVSKKGKKITFIDTPGHAAFDKMRARGAKITDIAILIVAADDGVMPQTIEAIKHIQGQSLPMIVAINKIDKQGADVDRVKQQLAEHNVVAEDWGGEAIIVPISAAAGTNIDKLLEMILLVSDMNGYKANANKEASGSIIDSNLDKHKGAVVTVLVQSGTLRVGDTLLAGTTYGKVKAMTDDAGKAVRKATPSMPVQVLGFQSVPKAGDMVYVVDEKLTKQVVEERRDKEKIKKTRATAESNVENFLDKIHESSKKHLNVIVKADVAGSAEAIIQTLSNITSDEVDVHVISSGVGAITDNDVTLAELTGALLIAFHVGAGASSKALAKKQKVKINEFKIIYEIFDFVTDEMVKLFSPKFQEKHFGRAEVMAVFKSSAIGLIAGCRVIDGKIMRNSQIRLKRGKEDLGVHNLASLKIKTQDTKEVASGHECGIKLEGNIAVQEGDIMECFGMEQLPIVFNGKKYEF